MSTLIQLACDIGNISDSLSDKCRIPGCMNGRNGTDDDCGQRKCMCRQDVMITNLLDRRRDIILSAPVLMLEDVNKQRRKNLQDYLVRGFGNNN